MRFCVGNQLHLEEGHLLTDESVAMPQYILFKQAIISDHKQQSMRKLLSLLFLVTFSLSCQNSATPFHEERKEVEDFLGIYKQLLQNAKFDSVALLYVDTGFVSLADGKKEVQTIDSVKAFYSRLPKILNDFRWEDTRIDILSKKAALVTSFFYWLDKNSPDTTKQSYTGVFLKTDKGWKIMHEHESLDIATMVKIIKNSENKE